MKSSFLVGFSILVASSGAACGATSGESQQKALTHQQNSDQAAQAGAYGRAESEQRKAHDAHHDAVTGAIDEDKPIPPQTKPGDVPAPKPSAN